MLEMWFDFYRFQSYFKFKLCEPIEKLCNRDISRGNERWRDKMSFSSSIYTTTQWEVAENESPLA